MIPGLLAAGAMALWHGVEFYEKEKVVGEEYYQQWPNVSFLLLITPIHKIINMQ